MIAMFTISDLQRPGSAVEDRVYKCTGIIGC